MVVPQQLQPVEEEGLVPLAIAGGMGGFQHLPCPADPYFLRTKP